MNKKLYTLFAILISFLVVNVVRAADVYEFDWKTQNSDFQAAVKGISFNGGYLTVDYAQNGTIIGNYDIRGNKIKETNLGPVGVIEIQASGKEFYVLTVFDSVISVSKYDENLTMLKKVQVSEGFTNIVEFEISLLRVDENSVKVFGMSTDGIVKYDRNLENPETIELNQFTIADYEPMFINLIRTLESYSSLVRPRSAALAKDKYAVGAIYNDGCIGSGDDEDYRCMFPRLYFYDSNGNQKWYKQLNDYNEIYEIKFVDDYIVVTADKYNEPLMDIIIYDVNGNVVQTITSTAGWMNIADTEPGFMVTEGYCPMLKGVGFNHILSSSGNDIDSILNAKLKDGQFGTQNTGCCGLMGGNNNGTCISNHHIYYLVRNIATQVTKGKGTVTVAKSSKPGEPVTFVVKPEPGYVLGEVRVTDANGKVLIFKDYTFTMPNADVLVEAEFLPANPETKDIAIMVIVIAGITAIGIILLNYKKIKEIS